MKCSQVLPDFCVFEIRQRLPPPDNFAGVADLAAHLGVERRRVQHDGGLVFERDDFEHVARAFQLFEADKVRRRGRFDLRKRNDFFLLRGAGAGALLLHQFFKAVLVHGQAAFARHQFGEIERETVGVVKSESKFAWNNRVFSGPFQSLEYSKHHSRPRVASNYSRF